MDEYMTFDEACEELGINKHALINNLQTFAKIMEDSDMWGTLPDGARDNFEESLRSAIHDLPITESFFELLVGLSDVDGLRSDGDGELMISPDLDIDGLENYEPIVASLVKIAVVISESACNDKVAACVKNKGPASMPIVVFYMTKKTPGENIGEIDMTDHKVHVIEFDSDIDSENIEQEFTSLLGEAFSKLGPPSILGMISDTLVREFDSAEDAYKNAHELQELETIYMTSNDNRVNRAISFVIAAKNTEIVTAYAPYTYDDKGIAEFALGGYSVNSIKELEMDLSDRGVIAKVFDSFLQLGSI